MWRKKKFLIPFIIAVAVIAGSLGGVVLADESEDASQPGAVIGSLWERASEIYQEKTGDTLDVEALQEAIGQARDEMQAEALQNRLDNLVEEGKITQEQADEIQDWLNARPDALNEMGGRSHWGFRGMGGMPGFGGPCSLEGATAS